MTELGNIALSPEELEYLKAACPYFSDSYLRFLTNFRLRPSEQVKVLFNPLKDNGSPNDLGDIHFNIGGLWLHTILYEIPLLALTSEAYFRFCDKDWSHEGQEQKAYAKGEKLMEHGCVFSEFGTRRRRDYHTHDLVMHGLTRATSTASEQGWKGKLVGTSNVHFAMKYKVPPAGTIAHEWFMGIASITNDYEHANETALRYWVGCFGEGVLGIALTDTFGTPTFLKAFKKSLPTVAQAEVDTADTQLPSAPLPAISATHTVVDAEPTGDQSSHLHVTNVDPPRSYAQTFTGVRQDSGSPLEFVKLMRDFYVSQGITDKKTIVFSDSLNVELCLKYKQAAEEAGFNPTFGIGTFFTSRSLGSRSCLTQLIHIADDFTHPSTGKKSLPLNIVIKLSSASGRPAIKISDNVGKNTGDSDTVNKVKETLGYVEKKWAAGDEKTRWGVESQEATMAEVQE